VNRFELLASVVSRDALRYTPAGVPVVNCMLSHSSEVVEAGVPRRIEMTIQALAAGGVSNCLERCALGHTVRFAGFLAHRSRHSRNLVFHITELQELDKD
jgi:primosomal replication protein N